MQCSPPYCWPRPRHGRRRRPPWLLGTASTSLPRFRSRWARLTRILGTACSRCFGRRRRRASRSSVGFLFPLASPPDWGSQPAMCGSAQTAAKPEQVLNTTRPPRTLTTAIATRLPSTPPPPPAPSGNPTPTLDCTASCPYMDTYVRDHLPARPGLPSAPRATPSTIRFHQCHASLLPLPLPPLTSNATPT